MSKDPKPDSLHTARLVTLRAELARVERLESRISLLRLVAFLGAAAAAVSALKEGSALLLGIALALAAAFFAGVVAHARINAKRRELLERASVHERHLARLTGAFTSFAHDGAGLLPADHPYAVDVDLVGPGSLFQRIDVTQTCEGERALAHALGTPLPAEQIAPRQLAVQDLVERHAFREEVEVLARLGQRSGAKLDHAPFMTLVAMPSVFTARPWLKPTMLALLAATALTFVLARLGVLATGFVWLPLLAQALLLYQLRAPVHGALDLLTARIGFAEAYAGMLRIIESEPWQAPLLVERRRALDVQGESPSAHMRNLARIEGFAQLRTQGPLYIVLNVLTLWDLFCLERLERFVRTVGPHAERWFETVGELELLCSLATLRHGDPSTSFPRIVSAEQGITAKGLAHPLLAPATRVANDLALDGPGSLLLVTGSNMAGKSTLLRALGLNVALALAGGPVCARELVLPCVRLRASMRIDDSLQRGASYFHAELTKLRMVVSHLEEGPPVLFLLDELLRGTNARARHAGARGVILHLVSRGAMGVVATHDVALSELEGELPHAHNVHFTDVFEDGEMRFDYKLREGVVTTSNALRLLAMAGIEVEQSDRVS